MAERPDYDKYSRAISEALGAFRDELYAQMLDGMVDAADELGYAFALFKCRIPTYDGSPPWEMLPTIRLHLFYREDGHDVRYLGSTDEIIESHGCPSTAMAFVLAREIAKDLWKKREEE